MPAAKSPRESISKREPSKVEGADARVRVMIYSPDHPAEEFTFTIPNIRGCTGMWTRKPVDIAGVVLAGLRTKYGNSVK